MSDSLRRQQEIFEQAIELPAGERRAFVERSCGGDAELARQVLTLLAAADAMVGFLEEPPTLVSDARLACAGAVEATPDRIGRYCLKRKLGEGGAGVVYEAEQVEPVKRRVALKLMKPGTDTGAAISRFEAERQALAMMDHPNIARVFDAGAAEHGRLYFVMELVDGVRITEYCDRERLAVGARLELFEKVCAAVEHAHQKGVIHRDLKPSNILVATVDGAAVPKVIDFGIAKAIRSDAAPGATLTRIENLLGTPAYMSPEQAIGGGRDVDTRTDIYSLGVLLYELLTGLTPFDSRELARIGLRSMQEAANGRDPMRPSARLSTTAHGDLAAIANQRRVEPATLIRRVRGDLDWVVLKAMEQERERRYATARELLHDLQRHLRDDPVLARPPSAAYRVSKFIRRHKVGVWVGAAALAMVTIVAAVSWALAARTARAEHRAQRTGAVFSQLLEGLGQTVTLGPPSDLRRSSREWNRLLDQAATRATTQVADDPEVAAEVSRTFGRIYLAAGRVQEASRMFRVAKEMREKLHGPEDPLALEARYDRGIALWMASSYAEGNAEIEGVLETRRRILGPDHPDTVRVLEMLGFGAWVFSEDLRAEALLGQAVDARERTGRVADFDNKQFSILNAYAMCLLRRGRTEEGLAFARRDLEVLASTPEPPRRFLSRANLTMSWALKASGRDGEALSYARQAVALDLAEVGPDHSELSYSLGELANGLAARGDPRDFGEAEDAYRRCISIWRATRAAESPGTLLGYLDCLAKLYSGHGRFADAAPLLDEAWAIAQSARASTTAEYEARILKTGVMNYTAWEELDPSRREQARVWEQRLAEFGERLRTCPHDTYRLNAVRGLAAVFTDWATFDPSRTDAAELWRSELSRSEAEMRERLVLP